MEAARIPWRPLGRLLVEQGLLSEEELERALEQQAATGRRLGETLVELEFVSHLSLSRALAEQYGIELTSETGFGTGLRAEIERRHDEGREPAGERPAPSLEAAPALSLVPEPDPEPEELELELEAFDGEGVLLAQLEEQWAKLAAAEERLAEAKRELTTLREAIRHKRNQAERFVERIRTRDRRLAELSASGRELAALRWEASHRRDQAVRFVERIRGRDRRIVELSATESKQSEPDSRAAPGHLIYAQLPGRYVLVERDGAPPEPDMLLELPEVGEEIVLVDRVGRSPLPNDTRPCAFASSSCV